MCPVNFMEVSLLHSNIYCEQVWILTLEERSGDDPSGHSLENNLSWTNVWLL